MSDTSSDGGDREEQIQQRLEQLRVERIKELKSIQRLGSAQSNRRQAVENILSGNSEAPSTSGGYNESSVVNSGETPPIRRHAPEAVLVEVRGLFESRPVSRVLQSSSFRRELETLVRSGLSRFQPPSAPRLASANVNRGAPSPVPSEPTTDSSSRDLFVDRPQQNQPQTQQENSNRPIPTISLSEIERIRREEFVEEINELLHTQLVSNVLDSVFRHSLENTLRDRSERIGTRPGRLATEAIENLPPSNIVRNDFSHLGIFPQHQSPDQLSLDDSISIVSTGAVPYRETSAGMSRQLISLKKEMNDMKQMMKMMMQNQVEMQRMVRQEISAAIGGISGTELASSSLASQRSNPENQAGQCLICLDSLADTVVYKCGHICLCQSCSGRLKLRSHNSQIKCPVCRAPVVDMLRVYKSGVSADNTTDA